MRGLAVAWLAVLLLSASWAKPVVDSRVLEEEGSYTGQRTSELAFESARGAPTRTQVDNFVRSAAAVATAVGEEIFRDAEPIRYAGIPAPAQKGLTMPLNDCIVACNAQCLPECLQAERSSPMCSTECNKFCAQDCKDYSPANSVPTYSSARAEPAAAAGGPPGMSSSRAGPTFGAAVRQVAMNGAAAATAAGEEMYREDKSLEFAGIKAAASEGKTLSMTRCIPACTYKCVHDCMMKEGAPHLCSKDCNHFCGEDCRTGFQTYDTTQLSHGDRAALKQKAESLKGGGGGGTSEDQAFQYESASNAVFPWQSKKLDSKVLGPRECVNHCNFECLRECTEGYDKPHQCPDECRTNCNAYCHNGMPPSSGHARNKESYVGYGSAVPNEEVGQDWEEEEKQRRRRHAQAVGSSSFEWLVHSALAVAGCACVFVLVRRRIGDLQSGGYAPLRAAAMQSAGRKLSKVREEPEYA